MEMNLHMPQDADADSELRYLAAVPYQIVSPANNKPIIGIFQDSMLGCNRFTREGIKFTPRQAMNILMMFQRVDENLFTSGKKSITNFDLLSQILPPLSLHYKTKLFGDGEDSKTSNNVLEIKNGEYLRGQMDKDVLGSGTRGLIHRICNDFGNFASSNFIDDLQNIITEYMKSSAYSVGISDLISDKKTKDSIIKVINEKKSDVKNLIDQTQIGILENNTGKSNQDEFETKVNNILNQASSEAGKIGLKSLDKDNRFVIMVNAGSKGSDLNISQMISCLGQQNVDGKRIPYGFTGRTLPHFTKFDDTPGARGFVESSYINGLNPQELFFHAMAGRIGLIDTAVKTSSTGYIQRRLIKGLEDLMVNYDMTVRTNKGKIVEFSYGDDGIDPVKVENQGLKLVEMSIQDIYGHYNIPDETGKIKTLSNFFEKGAMSRLKKQNQQNQEKCKYYTDMMIQARDEIIKNIFKYKGDSSVSSPVGFAHIISNIQGQQNLTSNSIVDLTPLEAFEMIENTYYNLEMIRCAVPSQLFKTLYYFHLSPKELLIVKRFNRAALTILLETIVVNYKRAIVAPGEMVGMIAAQSIGEPTTQMSQFSKEKNKIIIKNKTTNKISLQSVEIGSFCDKIIRENPHLTFNTGHVDSVETLLETLEDEYFIIGVDGEEKTHWNKISHVSRHPVNGDMMKVVTKSGRVVETTTSHSHLIRKDQTVLPITGSDLKKGMRIPVAKHIDNTFVENTVEIGGETYELDYLFGCFIGNYLAENPLDKEKVSCIIEEMCGVDDTCSSDKKIPDFAFLAPNEFKAGLIQTYFDLDGKKSKQNTGHYQMGVSSRSKQLIKDMALMLNYFDIFGIIQCKPDDNDSSMYHLNIPAKYCELYQERIGSLVHEDKLSEMLSRYVFLNDAQKSTDDIDKHDKINGLGEIISNCRKILKEEDNNSENETVGRRTLQKYIKEFEQHPDCHLIKDELRILNQASNSNVIWDEIKSIEIYTPEQTEYVYDFTVPANQTFMTDYGIIVHNTLNSVTYETPIIVRNRSGQVQKVEIGEFIEKNIANPKKLDYYKEKDTTYAELLEYFEIPSCTEEGDIVWKEVEAVTRHPVINKDGTNTMLKITTEENREVIATKAKSFLKLVEGKIVPVDGDSLKVGDYLPVSTKNIDFQENNSFDLKEILPPTEYIYSSEMEKAKAVMNEHHWWKNHNGKTFVLPYSRSDSIVSKLSDKMREGQQSKTVFAKNCVYMKKNGQANYTIPETIPLDYNFGYLIGAYAAEGCMTKHQISIANNETEYFAPILELCEKWNITTKTYKRENCIQDGWTTQDIRIYNSLLCRLLENLCGKLSHNKFISDCIIFSNRECLLGFLDAYIGGDGTVSKKDHSIMVSSVSKNMLIDVQQILNILGIYSHIGKYKKPETNNRGSKNIKQSYNLIVRNKQAPKLASMLNMKIKNKQDSLQYIFAHKSIYKYEFARKHATVPNEIDGEICFEERSANKYRDVLFDKIKSIEEVSNTTNYAYDLTVLDTKNFNIYNGLALRDTFHHTGISSKSNVTRGVPRIEEILSLSSEPKNPSLTVFLKPEDQSDREKATSTMYMLEHTKMQEIVKSTEISFDPDDLNSMISEDHSTMEQYRSFESMMDECNEVSLSDDTNEKSKWILRMEMEPEIMLEKNITMDDVNFTLKNSFGDEISCVYSDYNADKLVFRIRMNSVMKQSANKSGPKKAKVNPLDQSDQIYLLKNFQDQLLNNIVIRGIKKINKVILRKIKDNVVETAGSYKKEDIWVLDTVGSNLIDVLALDYIDSKRTFSNDIVETYNVFGIEAARQTIMNELAEVIEFDGTYINYHHMCMLCDRMTFTNKMISIFRHGINNDNIGPIAKASFEETPEMFLKAARHAELDMMRGVSANIMCGQEGLYGTNAFQVVLDLEEMRKLSDMIAEEIVDPATQIEKSFGDYENVDDKCSSVSLTIENNISTIKSSDLGTDNDYQPGF